MKTFCHALPKIELHAHLNGSLSKSTLQELGCTEQKMLEYDCPNTDIKTVFDLFKVAHNLTDNHANLYIVTKNVIKEFAQDNVIYLELRTTPRCGKDMSEDVYIETVVRAIMAQDIPKTILVKLILSLDRKKNHDEQLFTLNKIIKFKRKYPNVIKGVDLSGDPSKGKFIKELFEKARNNDLFTAIHCGEIKNFKEIKEILSFLPDRLGHCTFLHPKYCDNSSELWDIYKKLKIPVECCLTSNVRCLTIKSYEEHHVQEWIAQSMPFCLGTDDKGVFDTCLSQEFFIAASTFNLNKLDLWTICRNSVEYSFANEKEKELLRSKLNQWSSENMNHDSYHQCQSTKSTLI
ncbi:adenosine deaminase-like protein [Euwallacea fornicatus]|uniref:adenosine deaminase-like protein n=1 Tax=Euwallacea fornicatus TaxID=995702 RepID=UPI00338E3DD8